MVSAIIEIKTIVYMDIIEIIVRLFQATAMTLMDAFSYTLTLKITKKVNKPTKAQFTFLSSNI